MSEPFSGAGVANLNPKALEAAVQRMLLSTNIAGSGWRRSRGMSDDEWHKEIEAAITAYLAALPLPAEAGELLERLRRMNPWKDMDWPETVRDAADLILALSSQGEHQ